MATKAKAKPIGRRHRKPATQATQRKLAVSQLVQTVGKAKAAARGEDLEAAKEAMTKQLRLVGEGDRFYANLGLIDDQTSYRITRMCEKLQKRFYDQRYNTAHGF